MAQYKSSAGVEAAAAQDENGVPLFLSGQNDDDDDGSAYLCAGALAATQINDGAAAPTKTGTPPIFSGARAATRANDGAEHLHPDVKTAAPYISSVEPAAAYCNSDAVAGEALPLAPQKANVPGAFAERLRRALPVLGLSVASLAVAGLAAGDPTPAAGFGLFLMLIAGLSAVTIRVLRG